VPVGRRPMLDRAHTDARLVREGDPEWRDDVPVRVETIPVPHGGRVIAVIARNTNLLGVRTPSRLELSYLQSAADLTAMIATGDFPRTPSAARTRTRRASETGSSGSTSGAWSPTPARTRCPSTAVSAGPAISTATSWPTSPGSWCRHAGDRTRRR